MKATVKSEIKAAVTILFGSFILSWIVSWFLAVTVEWIGGIIDIFDVQIEKNGEIIFAVAKEICFLIAFIVANMILYTYQKDRKKRFLKDTQGLIPIKEGLVYHMRNYLQTEIIIAAIHAIGFCVLYCIDTSLSPVGILYRLCGIPLGFVVSVLLLLTLQTGHILAAQYRWRLNALLEG